MDDEPELDEDDIDALCVIEQVEEGSQQRYLLRGLSLIELNQSQIIDFVRIIGKKVPFCRGYS
ncbi:unnamed protein product [Anisakis simplex]|uniref:Transposase n=1 Tax=Anisakis simplex TaxID=6269 RepID=A0A0M3KH68_ANISI|nr:unnamed protein product [Anisakis simplex]